MSEKLQLSLLAFGGLPEITSTVFSASEKKNEAGIVVGQTIKLSNRRDIAKALNLVGKGNAESLDAKILEARDAMKPKVAELVTRMCQDPEWTASNIRTSVTKSGELRATIALAKVSRKKGPSDEQIAAVMGMTVEQVRELRARQEAKIKGEAPIDVPSVEVEADIAPPATEEKPSEPVTEPVETETV